MENVPTNWCESRQKCNFGIIRAVSGPPGTFNPQKKNYLTGNFKLWPNVKICTVLRNVLAETPKINHRKEEKGYFGSNFDHFG